MERAFNAGRWVSRFNSRVTAAIVAERQQDCSWPIDAMIEIEKREKILPGLIFGDE